MNFKCVLLTMAMVAAESAFFCPQRTHVATAFQRRQSARMDHAATDEPSSTSAATAAVLSCNTSPPLREALDATPEAFRCDAVIEEARALAKTGECTVDCQISFAGDKADCVKEGSRIGIMLYGGYRIDPRAYSPLAQLLATKYGLPVVIPIFAEDITFTPGVCDTGRLEQAQAQFPDVTDWILVGHSWGGLGALTDAWARPDEVSGLVLLACAVDSLGCGEIDFSTRDLPMASVTASNDLILDQTRLEVGAPKLANDTLIVDIDGGNHAGFACYDVSDRHSIFPKDDGVQTIAAQTQWDLTASYIYNVASRIGVELPTKGNQVDSSEYSDSAAKPKALPL